MFDLLAFGTAAVIVNGWTRGGEGGGGSVM